MAKRKPSREVGAKARKSCKAELPSPPKPDPAADLTLAKSGLNAAIQQRHVDNVHKVMKHHLWNDILNQVPLGISSSKSDNSGSQAVFEQAKGVVALKKTTWYMAGINFSWVDPFFLCGSVVPVMWTAVNGLMVQFFKTPAGFQEVPLEIAVFKASDDDDPDIFFDKKGEWKSATPQEVMMAWYAAAARDIDDDELIEEWHRHFISIAARFKVLDREDDLEWRQRQLRENFSQIATSLQQSPVQRIFDLAQKRDALGGPRIPASTIHDVYTKNLQLSELSEPLTLTYCEQALAVWDRALAHKDVQEVVLHQEQ